MAFIRTQAIWRGTRGEKSAVMNAQEALNFFGEDIALGDITTEAVDGYIEFLEDKGNSPGTINRKISALSKMFRTAVDRGWVVARPKMERKKERVGRIRWITDSEESELLNLLCEWGREDHADAIRFLLDTGMRPGELWRVDVRDIDLKNDVINIWDTKADLPRSVPMTSRVKHIATRRSLTVGEGLLFPYNKAWLRHVWDKAKSSMGLENDSQFVPHTCRHTCASRLVQAGVSLKVVQEWLGHRRIETTLKYAHLAPKSLAAVVHVLER